MGGTRGGEGWRAAMVALLVATAGRVRVCGGVGDGDVRCPVRCACAADELGRLATRCLGGGMRLIPVDDMDRSSQVVEVAAPSDAGARPNSLTVGPIFTQPRPFTRLEELHIVASNVPSIGRFSFWGLPALRVLNLTCNNITALESDNFRGLLQLTHLHLDGNAIADAPSETFRHLTALRALHLSDNRLAALAPRAFRRLAALERLDLGGNPLADLDPDVFGDVRHLRALLCRRCLLRRLDARLPRLLPDLVELDLGDNRLEYIAPGELAPLPRLRTLRLDGNRLSVVVDDAFAALRALRELSLGRNRLAALAPRAFRNLSALATLDLARNKLERLSPPTFEPLAGSLRRLDLSGAGAFPPAEMAASLRTLPELRTLALASLGAESMSRELLAATARLADLDLSDNRLAECPLDTLERARHLRRLNLSGNQLRALSERCLARLWALADVDLSRNPWNCERCDAGPMLAYARGTSLERTVMRLECETPPRLRGVPLGDAEPALESCAALADEARSTVLAGALLAAVVLGASVLTAAHYCYTRRRGADYYTHEEKRRSTATAGGAAASDAGAQNHLVYFCERGSCDGGGAGGDYPPRAGECSVGDLRGGR